MPLPVISNIYRVAMLWLDSGTGLRGQTTMHFRKASSSASAVATSFDANVTAAMWQSLRNTTSVKELHVTPLDGSSATYILATSGAKWAGVGGSGEIIPAEAVVVSLRTLYRGKSFRGRLYLPFVAEASQAGGLLTPADVTTAQAAWNAFLTAMVAAATFPAVASYLLATSTDVSSIIYEGTAGTQRRRQSRLR